MNKLLLSIKRGSFLRLPLFVLFLFIFTSCKKEIKNNLFNSKTLKENEFLTPVGYKFNSNLNRFQGNLSLEKLIDFYKTNLENWGWDIQDYYNLNTQAIFICKKINKSFSLLLKQDNNKTYIYIFEKRLSTKIKDINYKNI